MVVLRDWQIASACLAFGLVASWVLAWAWSLRRRRADRVVARLLDAFAEPAWLVDRRGGVLRANRAAQRVPGGPWPEPEARSGTRSGPVAEALQRALRDGRGTIELDVAGEVRHLVCEGLPAAAGDPVLVRIVEPVRASARLAPEESLARSLRLELVGQLARGIAHHFNNLLTSILGYTDLVLRELAADAPERGDLEEVRRAGLRGADLTRHLLSFSRQTLALVESQAAGVPFERAGDGGSGRFTVDLVPIVDGLGRLLRPCMGESMRIEIRHEQSALWIAGRVTDIENLIVHLVLTVSRFAGGGCERLDLRTGVDAADHRFVVLVAGWTGTAAGRPSPASGGSSPLFGEGLAALEGTVATVGGRLETAQGAPGEPGELRVLLRRAPTPSHVVPSLVASSCDSAGETILLVEDELLVRRLVSTGLREAGYRVIEASSAREAFAVVEEFQGKVDLLLSDLVLPNGTGLEIAERLRERDPELRVLFMSGYEQPTFDWKSLAGAEFLAKPFTTSSLLARLRGALGERLGEAAPPGAGPEYSAEP